MFHMLASFLCQTFVAITPFGQFCVVFKSQGDAKSIDNDRNRFGIGDSDRNIWIIAVVVPTKLLWSCI